MATMPEAETRPPSAPLNGLPISSWDAWLKHPQRVWLRRALVQVHLWTGIILSLYVLLMSSSGTILIFRVDLSKASLRTPPIVAGPGPRLTVDQLKQAARRAYPHYAITEVTPHKNPAQPV